MTEKLVKTGNDYILYSKDKTVLGITSGTMEGRMLSLKNCESIANGYDLDELAVLSTKEETTIVGNQKMAQGFIKGFQKALELLGDKKFSEDEMWNMFYFGDSLKRQIKSGKIENKHMGEIFDDYIQSLQQNEWDVEIVMECPQCKEYGYISECRNVCNKKFIQPKLDADGCLILRRI